MRSSWLVLVVSVLTVFGAISWAQRAEPVYKSTDKDGNVTFSGAPAPDAVAVERVRLAPGPTPEQQAEAVKQAEELNQLVEQQTAVRRAIEQEASPIPAPGPVEVDITQLSQAQLDARCEDAREAKINPLRESEIESCKQRPRTDPGYCDRFYKTYGQGGRTIYGGYQQPMFKNLKECVEAESERQRRGGQ